jgi:hypothetical protein
MDSGFRIQDSGFRIQDSGFRIQDSGWGGARSRRVPESVILDPESSTLPFSASSAW